MLDRALEDAECSDMNTLARIVSALGPPQAFREMHFRDGRPAEAAVARWRHRGGLVDRSGADTYQLIFNISGGQVVELRSSERTTRQSITAGSVAVVCPGDSGTVEVLGSADTLHFFFSRELMECVSGRGEISAVPDLAFFKPQLQAAAAQVLVALSGAEGQSGFNLDAVVMSIASRFAQPALQPTCPSQGGGLSPGARRRVNTLIDERLADSDSGLSVSELAAAAHLSIHHFIKSFRRSEGMTPYARVMNCRIEKALSLLLRRETRIDQIADQTGFSSAAHFVSTFRKRVGVTPGALRNAAHAFDRT